MKQKTEIEIEIEETIAYFRRGERFETFCPECDSVVEMTTPQIAAVLTKFTEREIYRLVETGKVHFVETDRVLICRKSLTAVSAETEIVAGGQSLINRQSTGTKLVKGETKMKKTALLILIIFVLGYGIVPAQTTIIPVSGTLPLFSVTIINDGAGDQYDPHVSGDWASYTSDNTIRYYSFAAAADAGIPLGLSVRDLLSDVSGSRIVFARIIPASRTAMMVFDAANPGAGAIEINSAAGSQRIGSAIGGATVAYADFGIQVNGEMVAFDLNTSTAARLTNDTNFHQNPQVSPDGTVVVWEHCATSMSNCDVWQAVFASGVWTTSASSAEVGHEANPDTNGLIVVYDATRSGERDLFWKPVGGGAEVKLQMAGLQENPSIAGSVVAFEHRNDLFSTADLFLYDVANNRVYQVTDTLAVNEQLNDITMLNDGRVRLVWATDEVDWNLRNVRGATFLLPGNARGLLDELIVLVGNAGPGGSLANKLREVSARLDNNDVPGACGLLNDFINEVRAQSGKHLTEAQATAFISAAQGVIAALGC